MAKLTNSQLTEQLTASHVSYQLLEDQLHDANERIKLLIAERDMFAKTAHDAIARNDELTEQLDCMRFDLQNYVQALYDAQTLAKPNTQQRRVYEFNPAIPGDFARAAQLAKANKGSVKRMAV